MADITVSLKKPIEAHGQTIKELVLREPCLDDMVEMEKAGEGQFAQTRALIGVLSNIPPSSAGKICASDVKKVAAELAPFLED